MYYNKTDIDALLKSASVNMSDIVYNIPDNYKTAAYNLYQEFCEVPGYAEKVARNLDNVKPGFDKIATKIALAGVLERAGNLFNKGMYGLQAYGIKSEAEDILARHGGNNTIHPGPAGK